MTKRLLTAPALLFASSLFTPIVGHAQTFKMEKFDIKGDGGTDYVAVEAATGRVFVSRGNHMMVVDGATGKVLGDIPNTPGVHGAGIATKAGHGFTTNGGDSTVTMFDLKTLAVIKQIPVMQGGLDGIMYDEPDDKIILTNHSRPIGTLTAIDPKTGDIVGTAELEDNAPEGAAADGKGHIFVNNESKNTMQVIDVKTWKATASWPLAPCEGPTGIAYDKASNRIFSGCSNTSVVVDPEHGQGRGEHQERHARGRPGMGSVEEADLTFRTAARATSPWSTRIRPTSTPWSPRSTHSPARRPSPSIRRRTTRTSSSPSAVRLRRRPLARRRRRAEAAVASAAAHRVRSSLVVYRDQAVAIALLGTSRLFTIWPSESHFSTGPNFASASSILGASPITMICALSTGMYFLATL